MRDRSPSSVLIKKLNWRGVLKIPFRTKYCISRQCATRISRQLLNIELRKRPMVPSPSHHNSHSEEVSSKRNISTMHQSDEIEILPSLKKVKLKEHEEEDETNNFVGFDSSQKKGSSICLSTSSGIQPILTKTVRVASPHVLSSSNKDSRDNKEILNTIASVDCKQATQTNSFDTRSSPNPTETIGIQNNINALDGRGNINVIDQNYSRLQALRTIRIKVSKVTRKGSLLSTCNETIPDEKEREIEDSSNDLIMNKLPITTTSYTSFDDSRTEFGSDSENSHNHTETSSHTKFSPCQTSHHYSETSHHVEASHQTSHQSESSSHQKDVKKTCSLQTEASSHRTFTLNQTETSPQTEIFSLQTEVSPHETESTLHKAEISHQKDTVLRKDTQQMDQNFSGGLVSSNGNLENTNLSQHDEECNNIDNEKGLAHVSNESDNNNANMANIGINFNDDLQKNKAPDIVSLSCSESTMSSRTSSRAECAVPPSFESNESANSDSEASDVAIVKTITKAEKTLIVDIKDSDSDESSVSSSSDDDFSSHDYLEQNRDISDSRHILASDFLQCEIENKISDHESPIYSASYQKSRLIQLKAKVKVLLKRLKPEDVTFMFCRSNGISFICGSIIRHQLKKCQIEIGQGQPSTCVSANAINFKPTNANIISSSSEEPQQPIKINDLLTHSVFEPIIKWDRLQSRLRAASSGGRPNQTFTPSIHKTSISSFNTNSSEASNFNKSNANGFIPSHTNPLKFASQSRQFRQIPANNSMQSVWQPFMSSSKSSGLPNISVCQSTLPTTAPVLLMNSGHTIGNLIVNQQTPTTLQQNAVPPLLILNSPQMQISPGTILTNNTPAETIYSIQSNTSPQIQNSSKIDQKAVQNQSSVSSNLTAITRPTSLPPPLRMRSVPVLNQSLRNPCQPPQLVRMPQPPLITLDSNTTTAPSSVFIPQEPTEIFEESSQEKNLSSSHSHQGAVDNAFDEFVFTCLSYDPPDYQHDNCLSTTSVHKMRKFIPKILERLKIFLRAGFPLRHVSISNAAFQMFRANGGCCHYHVVQVVNSISFDELLGVKATNKSNLVAVKMALPNIPCSTLPLMVNSPKMYILKRFVFAVDKTSREVVFPLPPFCVPKEKTFDKVTIVVLISITDGVGPGMIVYPHSVLTKKLRNSLESCSAFDSWSIGVHQSGGLTQSMVSEYLSESVYPYLAKQNNNLQGSYFVVDWWWCLPKEHLFNYLPGYTILNLQRLYPAYTDPLDVALNITLQRIWGDVVNNWMSRHGPLKEVDLAIFFIQILNRLASPSRLGKWTSDSGLWPPNTFKATKFVNNLDVSY